MTLNEYFGFPVDLKITAPYTFWDYADLPYPENMMYSYQNSNNYVLKLRDTSNVTNTEFLFFKCPNLTYIAPFNTSNVTRMGAMFESCGKLTTIPQLDTSKVVTMERMFNDCMALETVPPMDTSKVTNMNSMFYSFTGQHNLKSLPQFDCTNVTNMGSMFSYYSDRMPYFTECGGWKNLKCNWDDRYGLAACAVLSYESCINILNGLWDFRGNGDNSTTRTLKVHPNFLTNVGDEISIGTSKGWIISA